KVTIHALQCSHDHTLFRSWHEEAISIQLYWHAAADKSACHFRMLPCLTKTLHVNLNEFAQSGHFEIALVRQTISPARSFLLGIELPSDGLHHSSFFPCRIKVEVIAKIRPMVERLHHDGRAASGFQFSANSIQKFQRDSNTL